MKTTTSFAIKANVAALLLAFLLTFVLGLVVLPLMTNVYFAGTFGVIVAFAGTFLATKAILKNTKFGPGERAVALERTWQIAAAVGVVLLLADIRTVISAGWVWATFSILTIVAQVVAVRMIAAKE